MEKILQLYYSQLSLASCGLKGLSYEIDFENVAKKGPRLVFEFFGGTSDFLLKLNLFFPVNAKITPIRLYYPIYFVPGLLARLSY